VFLVHIAVVVVFAGELIQRDERSANDKVGNVRETADMVVFRAKADAQLSEKQRKTLHKGNVVGGIVGNDGERLNREA